MAQSESPPRSDGAIPSLPKDWCLTLAHLTTELKAGKRATITETEIQWAREYERSLILPGMRLPQPGDVYELLEAMDVEFTIDLGGASSVGGQGRISALEKVHVGSGSVDPDAFSVAVLAFDAALELRLVSEPLQSLDTFNGIYFWFTIPELNRKFRLVQTGYEKKGFRSHGRVITDNGRSAPRSRKRYGPSNG